jgi:hypothetical protein
MAKKYRDKTTGNIIIADDDFISSNPENFDEIIDAVSIDDAKQKAIESINKIGEAASDRVKSRFMKNEFDFYVALSDEVHACMVENENTPLSKTPRLSLLVGGASIEARQVFAGKVQRMIEMVAPILSAIEEARSAIDVATTESEIDSIVSNFSIGGA